MPDRCPPSTLEEIRLDVWLDVACVFRTRSEALRACRGGKVSVNGQRAKPHREIRHGDAIAVTRQNGNQLKLIVKGLADRHLQKSKARLLYEDVTPPPSPEELEFRALLRHVPLAENSSRATPNKRDRRALRQAKGH